MGSSPAIKCLQQALLAVVGAIAASSALAQASSQAPVLVTGQNSATQQLLADQFVVSLGLFVVQGTITPTQHVVFMYFTNDTKGTRTLNKDINWGDHTFLAGFSATGEVRNSVYEFSYEYAFIKERDYEVSANIGLHYDQIKAQISGTATVTLPDGTVESASKSTKTASAPAPLPVIGVRGDWAATDNLLLGARAQVFKISYSGINGSWWDLRAEATWLFTHNIGVGIGYDYFDIHASTSKNNFNGDITWGYQGLMAFVRGGF